MNKIKIVVTDAKTIASDRDFFKPLEELGELVIYDLSTPEEIIERIEDCDAILCNKNVFNEENLKYAKNLKYIGLFATGYNNIDIEYAKKRNITVCNAGSYSTEAVAQHTFALMLNHFNKIRDYAEFCDEGGWQNSKVFSPFIYSMNELSRKTLGIVGIGNIGRQVAKLGNAFGMRVLAYARTPRQEENVKFVDLDTLYRESDVVTVHCPLNAQSSKMFNKETFMKFKKNSYFINTARGGVMDEDDLAWALNNDIIAGAAIDCLTVEPMSKDCALIGAKNLTLTPHVAWAMKETKERLLNIVCDNLRNYFDGKPTNVVNFN